MKKVLITIVLIIGSIFLYKYLNKEEPIKEKFIYEDILKNVEKETIDIDYFAIYGKYLNFKGNLPDNKNYQLVLKNNDQEINFDIKKDNSSENNDQRFVTNNYINDGINLEKLNTGEYIILLKELNSNKYYNLVNQTIYHNNTYYTMTKNKKNNVITFNEENWHDIKYWKITIKEAKLPDEVYDVIIDPGHGGVDTGAGNGKYQESKFNLEYAKALRDALEEEGVKVKLTRDTDTKIEHYGIGSRTGIPYETKAKLMLSLHLNSSNNKNQKGVEIYKAYYDNNTYAKLLADNIVEEVQTVYSNNKQDKIINGVYMRKYTESDIKSFIKNAKKDGYEPYNFTDDLTYYYFIRETGGIMTKAFTDGRNPKYQANPYRDANQGVEAYLCELAYISQKDDLKLVINKKNSFIKALKKSILSYVNDDYNSE